ncbi:TPA: phage head spike fiber domain-containing protein [Aeromonas veronii]
MAGVWKRDGTVAVTNGSKKVTGTGTTFADAKNGVAKGHLFCMTTGTTVDLYEVDYVVSNTELHLVQAFRGTTGTGKAYEIITTFSDSIPEFARKLNASLSYYQSQSDMVQQLFTSDAAEITVTAPDGTTHNLIPWKRVTSEGEGQAARAKVEADRSKTEADRSGTEADRAAGIVAAAALPMPDVWAPLSDSLRLITGYGRDVLVGSDVVARMVNFSSNSTATYIGKDGQLKTAAANEPRFEKEGLLIEGQSTNLFLNSENVAVWANPVGAAASTRELQAAQGGLVTCKVTAPSANGGVRHSYTAPAGGVHTVSFYLAKISASLRFIAENGTAGWGTGVSASINPATGTITGIIGITTAKSIPFLGGYIYELTLPSGKVGGILNAEWKLDTAGDMYIGMPQLEALPFATAYIPTASAAVIRSADVATLPQSLNLGESQLGFSLAVEFDSVNTGSFRVLELSDFSVIIADGASLTVRHAGKELYGINAPLGQRHHLAYSVGADGTITAALNGKLLNPLVKSGGIVSSQTSITLGNRWIGANDRALYGHLRDLKIWTKKPLTADQLKVASA